MGETVTVACKIPNGLILHTHKMTERRELVMGGGTRAIKEARRNEGEVRIKGCAGLPEMPNGMSAAAEYGGYALTPNVPKDVWDQWLEQHADSDLVKNRLIFAAEKGAGYVADMSRDHETTVSGLQPLDVSPDPTANDPRIRALSTKKMGVTPMAST